MHHNRNKSVLFVGDVTLDLTMVASHVPAPDEKVHAEYSVEAVGGVVANAAVACARSGATVKTVIQLGNDEASTRVRGGLAKYGIDVDAHVVEGRTSRVVVILEPHGEKRLLLDPGVSMFPAVSVVNDLSLEGIGWVHTAIYGAAATALVQKCRATAVPWSLDLEPASFSSGISTIASMIDGAAIIFCNDRAASRLGDHPVRQLLGLGAKAVVRTLGPLGARYFSSEAEFEVKAPPASSIADTTGAGDCLAGWFIGDIVAGSSLESALATAVAAATLSCSSLGAQSSYPNRSEVSEFLSAVNSEQNPK